MADPLSAFRSILNGAHRARPEALPALTMRAARLLDADEIVIYLVDYGQQNLVPLGGAGAPPREPMRIDGTLAGRAYALTETYAADSDGGARLWIPLLDGSTRIGV